MSFSGSYASGDVTFLLKPVRMEPTDVATKEHLIQSGKKHYSELLAPESPPDARYMELFEAAFERNHRRLAKDVASLAAALAADHPTGLVLVSLARAGTPIGVLLRRALARLGIEAPHYSISIIRDRGIDAVALEHIQAAHPGVALRFVDGWTGKGAIARELERALVDYATSRPGHPVLSPGLVTIADLGGVAKLAASGDDYLIPSAILNAVVSGLVSRTILSAEHVGPGEFHACVHYSDMRESDRSQWFVDTVDAAAAEFVGVAAAQWTDGQRTARRLESEQFMTTAMAELELADKNRIKPGVGEATRAVLRRVPARIFLRDSAEPDVSHLVHLARQKHVPIEVRPELPYAAVTVIQRLGKQHRPWS